MAISIGSDDRLERQRRIHWNILVAAPSALLLGLGGSASSRADALEEIVVTAQKRDQNLQDVGVSVTAFTGDDLMNLNVLNGKDIAAQTPNVMFVDSGNSMTNILNIRGVSQNDFNPHQESPNAIYVDQAYLSILPASNFQLFDLQRVEVLRGPQGTLYGRNATGGLVQYVSNKPTEETTGFVDVILGEYSRERVEAAFGGSLSDSIQGRFSGVWEHNDGWLKNDAGPDLQAADTYSFRGQLLFHPTDDTELLLQVTRGDGEKKQGYGHTPTGFNADGLEFKLPAGVDFYGFGPGTDSTGYRNPSKDPLHIEVDGKSYYRPDLWNFNAILNHEFDNVTLTSVTNYVDWGVSFSEDSDASPRFGINDTADSQSQQFSQEIRLNGESSSMRWLGGLYYLDISHKTEFTAIGELGYLDDLFAVLGVTNPGDIDGDPTFGQTWGLTDDLVSKWNQDTKSWAVFGQLEFDLTSSVTLIAGLRWTDDSKTYYFNSREFYAGTETTSDPSYQIWGTNSYKGKNDQGDWSGKVQLDWHASDNTLFYAGVSKGIKGGGFNAPTFGGPVTPFGQETLYDYEAGLKTTFADGAARLNAGIFYYDYPGYQAFSFVNLAGAINNLDATSRGAEIEFTWSPAAGLELLAGLSLLDATVKDVTLPSGRVVDNKMPLAPDYTYNLLVRKSWDLGEHSIMVQADYNYTDSYYSETLNNPAGEVDSYGIANARISYGSSNDNWQLSLNARNLGNVDVPVYHIPTGLGFAEDSLQPPRWFSVELLYSFR
jgi:iron complex outermembrane recepter protein